MGCSPRRLSHQEPWEGLEDCSGQKRLLVRLSLFHMVEGKNSFKSCSLISTCMLLQLPRVPRKAVWPKALPREVILGRETDLLANLETFCGQPLYKNIISLPQNTQILPYGGAWLEQEPSLSREQQKLTSGHHQGINSTMNATRKELPLGLIRVWKESITRDAGGSRFIKVVHGT